MLSLLAARSAVRLAGGLLARHSAAPVLSRSALSLRTFLTTAQLQFPATTAKAKATTTKPKPKPKTTKATAKKPVKKPVKNVVKAVKKPVEKKPKAPKYDRTLMKPPTRQATSAYTVFMKQYLIDAHANSVDKKESFKQGPKEWAKLSDAEKETYAANIPEKKAEYEKKYEEWYRALPLGYFREINRRRKEKGKFMLRTPKRMRLPPSTGYIEFFKDYRGTAPMAEMSLIAAAKSAGAAWRALPEAEKENYNQRGREKREEWKKNNNLA